MSNIPSEKEHSGNVAFIIGAMLIPPLMSPIQEVGL